MVQDIKDNFLDCTYTALSEDGNTFIGTIALLDCDLRSHEHLSPWVSSLYVDPVYRNQGVGKMLMDYVTASIKGSVYLWCYTEHEKDLYERWGFIVIDNTQYDDKPAWVMAK